MGDLRHDTALEGEDGHYRAELSSDWEIWGPNGGYVAAVALRAAGAHASMPRPASLVCQYLGVATFDEVQITTATLRQARRAEAIRVSVTQDNQPILEALVWMISDELDGLVHATRVMPEVPGPEELKTIEELMGGGKAPFRFWENLDYKPLEWFPPEQWETRPAGDGTAQAWLRFRPTATFDDPYLDAGRLLVAVDTFQWPAATRAHAAQDVAYMAPSLDLGCSFHHIAADDEWMLVDAASPVATGGLVGGQAMVWGADGRLLASGGQQMLCRPLPQQR